MASTPAIASGVSITPAGAGGMLTGGTGLDGLFGALMGGEMAAPVMPGAEGVTALPPAGVPMGEGMISVLLGAKAGEGKMIDPALALKLGLLGNVFAQTTTQTEVQLGDAPPLTVTGDAAAVAEFVAKVQEIYKAIIAEGKLTIGQLSDSKELAGALTEMGMAPEDAMGVAERIQTMLKLLENQQDVDDKTAGSLVAMMLAVMGQQPAPVAVDGKVGETPQLGLQILSVEQQPATPAASGMANWQMRASGDVTRDLLGLSKEPTAKDAKPQAEGDVVRKVEVAVTQDADASVAVGVGDIKAVHAPVRDVAVDAVPSASAQAAAAVTTTGATVKMAAEEVIQAPKGDTYYKLQADKNGVETLEAVKPAGEVKDAAIGASQTPTQPEHVAAAQVAAVASEAASFAERVAQINEMVDRAQVGKQVAVQMVPLLEQGGGTVRMTLNPEKLGHVTVELQVVDGKVHGSIAASDPAVVEQLARELHNLRHGLADAGLKLGEQGINLMLSNQGQQGQDQQNGQGGQNARNGQSSGSGEFAGGDMGSDLAANLTSWVAPERILDVNA